ncbi:hypothetical protein HJC10_05465 [Corallococcus exiguus]|uniref:hypothetical protein n=1 Tax=Corallococcus exiguus TaxID=83462 RepID=UPI0011E6007D|nr:hypothetical protein [Corallococcus exiguus]NNB85684.1 hypothetical protein [Corallococcus exiguus]NNC02303.1 hypothetical protein [Corallococcus exiguus]
MDEQTQLDAQEQFKRENLRAVYRQLFVNPALPRPPAPPEEQPGERVRARICELAETAIGTMGRAGSAQGVPRQEADAFLNVLHARTSQEAPASYALSNEQWRALVRAFTEPAYASLRQIQGISEVPFNRPDQYGELKVGPRELERLYSWLFDPRDEHQAHNYLHALKKAAVRKDDQGIVIVLELLFNDRGFTGMDWPVTSFSGVGVGGIVSLDIDSELLGRIMKFLGDEDLSALEPYAGGAVCVLPPDESKQFAACY